MSLACQGSFFASGIFKFLLSFPHRINRKCNAIENTPSPFPLSQRSTEAKSTLPEESSDSPSTRCGPRSFLLEEDVSRSGLMLLMEGARAQDKVLKKESAGGVQQITQLQAICTIPVPETPNHISLNKGQRRRNLSATHASRTNCKAKEGRWVELMRVAQTGDTCGQMTFAGLTSAISGSRRFRGSSRPFGPPRRAGGQWIRHWPAPSFPATPSPSFTHRGRRGH